MVAAGTSDSLVPQFYVPQMTGYAERFLILSVKYGLQLNDWRQVTLRHTTVNVNVQ